MSDWKNDVSSFATYRCYFDGDYRFRTLPIVRLHFWYHYLVLKFDTTYVTTFVFVFVFTLDVISVVYL